MTTITDATFHDLCELHGIMPEHGRAFVNAAGITIAPPDPPEAMKALSANIANSAMVLPGDWQAYRDGALAALQHADKVVREAQQESAAVIGRIDFEVGAVCDTIRRALGAIA